MSWIKGTVCAKHRNGDGRTLSVTAYAVPAPPFCRCATSVPLFVTCGDISPRHGENLSRPGEVFPLRGSFIRADRKIPKSSPFGGAGCDHQEQTERVVAVGDWGSSPPAAQKTSAGADVFVWCIIFYNFPHCFPVKKRRVVVARNTLPARSTVVGNSGWEGLQG